MLFKNEGGLSLSGEAQPPAIFTVPSKRGDTRSFMGRREKSDHRTMASTSIFSRADGHVDYSLSTEEALSVCGGGVVVAPA